jgi:tetratricopeptide (TPR) repeat protein
MRHAHLVLGTVLLAAGLSAGIAVQAQTMVSVGIGHAHDCFAYAKSGGRHQEGVLACNEALANDVLNIKDRAATYDNRGVVLDQMGRTDEALADFNTAISLDAAIGDPHINLGSVLIKQKQFDQALAEINTGIDLGVSFPYIGYYDRAVAYEMMGRFKESYYDYKKALALEPQFTQAAERLKDFVVTTKPANTPG